MGIPEELSGPSDDDVDAMSVEASASRPHLSPEKRTALTVARMRIRASIRDERARAAEVRKEAEAVELSDTLYQGWKALAVLEGCTRLEREDFAMIVRYLLYRHPLIFLRCLPYWREALHDARAAWTRMRTDESAAKAQIIPAL